MYGIKNINSIYKIISALGSGTYGEVLKVEDKNGKLFAVKVSYFDEDTIINPIVLREVSNLIKLKHNNIIKLHKVFISSYGGRNCLCLVLELCESPILDSRTDLNYFFQIVDALFYMYQNGFYHGDLSPKNVLVKGNDIILADFGFSRKLHRSFDGDLKPSLQVRPIEFLTQENKINVKKIDLWGLGCLLYSIFENEQIVGDDFDGSVFESDIRDKYVMALKKIEGNKNITGNFKSMILALLDFDPFKRITFEKIKYHEFFHSLVFRDIFIFKLEKYNTLIVKESVFDLIGDEGKLNLLIFINRMILMNDLEDEVLFLTVHNAKRIKFTKTLREFSGNNLTTIVVVLFWLANKVISKIYGQRGI